MIDQLFGTGWVVKHTHTKELWTIDEVTWFEGKGYLYTLKGIDTSNIGYFKRYYESKMLDLMVVQAQDESIDMVEALYDKPKAKVYYMAEYRRKRA